MLDLRPARPGREREGCLKRWTANLAGALLLLAVVPAFAQTRPTASNAGDKTGADWKKIAVQVDAPSTVGGCPAKLTAHGRITITAPLNVSYEWLRSDGQTSTGSVAIDPAGSKTVEYSGTVAGSGDG